MIRVNKTLKLAFALGLVWAMPTLVAFAQNKDLVEIETGTAVSTPATVPVTSTPVKVAKATASLPNVSGLIENVVMADGKILIKGKNLTLPKVSTLEDGRILLVFKNSGLSKPASSLTGTGLIKGVRWASHGKEAHLVLLADAGVHGTVEKIEGGYSFVYGADASNAKAVGEVKPKIEKTVTITAVKTEPAKPEDVPSIAPLSRLIGQALKPMENGWKIILTMDSPARYKVLKLTGPDRVLVHFSNTKMDLSEKEARQKLEGAKAKGLLQLEARQYMQKPQPIAEVALTLAPGASFQVDRDANQVVLIVTNVPTAEKVMTKAGNLNQLMTVEVDGADLKTVLKSIGQEAGYDTDISDAVAGTVNQRLKDVPLRTALSVLLAPGDYKYEVQGNLLRVGSITYLQTSKSLMPHVTDIITVGSMTPSQLDTLVRSILPSTNASKSSMDATRNVVVLNGTPGDISEYKSAMRDLKLDSSESDRITRVVKLNYSDPTITQGLLKPYLTPMGNAQVDLRSQSVVLWESASNMGVLLELIKEIDVPLQQVLIESTIVEVNIQKMSEIGVNWSATRSGDPSVTAQLSQAAGSVAGLTNPGTLAFGTLKSGFNVNATLGALEAHNNGKIISRPKIATSNGQAAMIQTIENVVYVLASTTVNNGTTTTTYSSIQTPLPIALNVTPRITDDGRITSTIAVTITSETKPPQAIGGGTTSQPETTTQQAQTTVTVKNGETIVIGGLVRDTVQENVTRVPLLGSLPLLGTLFRNTNKSTKKVELIIFITPTLMES